MAPWTELTPNPGVRSGPRSAKRLVDSHLGNAAGAQQPRRPQAKDRTLSTSLQPRPPPMIPASNDSHIRRATNRAGRIFKIPIAPEIGYWMTAESPPQRLSETRRTATG
jgi:hypothetical protein